jgi:hypothetical protein
MAGLALDPDKYYETKDPKTPTIGNPFGRDNRFFNDLLSNMHNTGSNVQGLVPATGKYRGSGPQKSGLGGMFNNIADQGMNGSIRSFDTAANRVRDRLAKEAGAQQTSFLQNNAGASQGSIKRGLSDIRMNQLSSYGDALTGLEDSFEQNRLAGLGIANQAATGLSDDISSYNTVMQNFNDSMNQYYTDNKKIDADVALGIEELFGGNLKTILDAMNEMFRTDSGVFLDLMEQNKGG